MKALGILSGITGLLALATATAAQPSLPFSFVCASSVLTGTTSIVQIVTCTGTIPLPPSGMPSLVTITMTYDSETILTPAMVGESLRQQVRQRMFNPPNLPMPINFGTIVVRPDRP